MKKIIIACEGQTEEAFVNRLLYDEFWPKGVFVEPRLISTSPRRKGGALSRQRVLRFLQRVLLEQNDNLCHDIFYLFSLPNVVRQRTK